MKKIQNAHPSLPWEIIDKVLIALGDESLALALSRFIIIKKINPAANFYWAYTNRHFNYLKYLHDKGRVNEEEYKRVVVKGTRDNHLNYLKYHHENFTSLKSYHFLLGLAAKYGHLDVVKYLDSIGLEISERVLEDAAEFDQLEVVKWLHDHRQVVCSTYAVYNAGVVCFRDEKSKVLDWFYENRDKLFSKYMLDRLGRSQLPNVCELFLDQ